MIILPKAIYRLNTIPTKIPMVSFKELGTILNLCGNTKDPRRPKQYWEREQRWRNPTSQLQTILQSYVTLSSCKSVIKWHGNIFSWKYYGIDSSVKVKANQPIFRCRTRHLRLALSLSQLSHKECWASIQLATLVNYIVLYRWLQLALNWLAFFHES